MTLTKLSFEQTHSIAKNIEGWLTDDEAKLLYNIASTSKGDGVIVEIGSWCAKSLTYITMGALSSGFKNKIYSIDPFLTSKDDTNGKYETFISNLKTNNIYDNVIHIKEKSQVVGQTFSEKIEFIFIDGFHKYESVKQDFELFYPKLMDNGYIAIHDVIYYQGPTDLAIELSTDSTFKIIGIHSSTILAQKVTKLTDEDIENNKRTVKLIQERILGQTLIQ